MDIETLKTLEILQTIPLEELEEIVQNLRQQLEYLNDFVSDQEQELASQVQNLENLQSKLAKAENQELSELTEQLTVQLAENKMLEETLIGQHRNIEKRESILKQHLQILLQRKGLLNVETHNQNELASLLSLLETAENPTKETKITAPTAEKSSINNFSSLVSALPEIFKRGTFKRQQWLTTVGISFLLVFGVNSLLKITPATQSTNTVPTFTDNEQLNIIGVTALGRIEPEEEVIKVSVPASLGNAKVSKLLVKQGERVKEKQIIAVLEEQNRRLAAVESAKKEVKVAQANLNIVKAGAKTGEIEAQKAKIARLQAQLTGEKTSKGAFIFRLEAQLAGEKQAQLAKISRLESEFNNAQVEYKRYQQLTSEGAISQSDLDRRRTELETARESVKEAKANLDRITDTLTQQIREAKAVYQKTLTTLAKQIEEARANLARIAEVRDVDVYKAQAELERAMANLKEVEADLDLVYVKAPSNGQVLKIHTHPGESTNLQEGIVELGKTDQMMVIAEVYESDIGKVQVGQSVTMTSESGAFSQKLQGEVSDIGLQVGKKDVLGSDPAADVDVRVIEVKIKLNPDSSQRVIGLTNAKVIAKILI
ncbi:MAG: HlyD family efflux transporter periplasmic adaptor subunit [Xenococcus sp. (in: cyanobacteria)]